jgi:hypothetical protein
MDSRTKRSAKAGLVPGIVPLSIGCGCLAGAGQDHPSFWFQFDYLPVRFDQ